MTEEYKDMRYNEGVEKGIEYRAKFCRASFEASNSCKNCVINRYNTSGLSCQTFMAQNPDIVAKLFESRIPETELADDDFMSGFKSGLQIVSVCCSLNRADCNNCPLGELLDVNTDCLDFCADNASEVSDKLSELIADGGIPYRLKLVAPHPIKTVSCLEKPESISTRSFYDEFCVRFPESEDSLDDVARSCCRNACFGLGDCQYDSEDDADCAACWREDYV